MAASGEGAGRGGARARARYCERARADARVIARARVCVRGRPQELATFLWALRSGQYEDLKGAGERILQDDPRDHPGSN